MIHAMLDLETLDTKTTATVLSLGVVAFDKDKLIAGEQWFLKPDTQKGRTVSASTLCWWMTQSCADARRIFSFCDSERAVTPFGMLGALMNFFTTHNIERIWTNRLDFDLAILKSLCYDSHLNPFWKYSAARDWATFYAVYKTKVKRPKDKHVPHDALQDSEWQAAWLQNLWLDYPELEC